MLYVICCKISYLIQVSGSGYKANTLFVNESGFYSLIISLKLPQARAVARHLGCFFIVESSETRIKRRKGGDYNI